MNCHRARQLVSPYLDHQLTGAEMLEIQRHLDGCRPCAEEYRAARDIKSLLRSLRVQEPLGPLDARIAQRLSRQGGGLWPALPRPHMALPLSLLVRPQGRRLGVALAFSCVTLFAITPSFAPPAADVAAARAPSPGGLEQTAFRGQTPDAGLRVPPVALSLLMARSAPDASGGASLTPAAWGVDPGPQDARGASPYAPPPLVDMGAEPLGDPAADGYVALADYRSH